MPNCFPQWLYSHQQAIKVFLIHILRNLVLSNNLIFIYAVDVEHSLKTLMCFSLITNDVISFCMFISNLFSFYVSDMFTIFVHFLFYCLCFVLLICSFYTFDTKHLSVKYVAIYFDFLVVCYG